MPKSKYNRLPAITMEPVEHLVLWLDPGLHVPACLPCPIYVAGDKPVFVTVHAVNGKAVLLTLENVQKSLDPKP